jgi:hypothetical protein
MLYKLVTLYISYSGQVILRRLARFSCFALFALVKSNPFFAKGYTC